MSEEPSLSPLDQGALIEILSTLTDDSCSTTCGITASFAAEVPTLRKQEDFLTAKRSTLKAKQDAANTTMLSTRQLIQRARSDVVRGYDVKHTERVKKHQAQTANLTRLVEESERKAASLEAIDAKLARALEVRSQLRDEVSRTLPAFQCMRAPRMGRGLQDPATARALIEEQTQFLRFVSKSSTAEGIGKGLSDLA
jgi:adenine-specific DNA methylase